MTDVRKPDMTGIKQPPDNAMEKAPIRQEGDMADARKLADLLEESGLDRLAMRLGGNYREAHALILAALRAYKSAQYVQPLTGWKVVPVEATPEMVQAAEDRHVEGATYIAENSIVFALWREVWKAMLAASPVYIHPGRQRPAKSVRISSIRKSE